MASADDANSLSASCTTGESRNSPEPASAVRSVLPLGFLRWVITHGACKPMLRGGTVAFHLTSVAGFIGAKASAEISTVESALK